MVKFYTEFSYDTQRIIFDFVNDTINWFIVFYSKHHSSWPEGHELLGEDEFLPDGSFQLVTGGRCIKKFMPDKIIQALELTKEQILFVLIKHSDDNIQLFSYENENFDIAVSTTHFPMDLVDELMTKGGEVLKSKVQANQDCVKVTDVFALLRKIES